MQKTLTIVLLILLSSNISAAVVEPYIYQHDKLTDSVKCDANPRFSYSLYLPSYYNAKSKWPVLFVFDPGGRSRAAVERFIPAAEKYGYIVACPPKSRNGVPWNDILEITDCMFGDVKKKYSVDPSRIYTAGFSGGSRVASAIAIMYKGVSGVIACGAGLPGDPSGAALPQFDMIGIVGNTDMNYIEMCQLENYLEKKGRIAELRIFEGGHKWPDSNILQGAVEWLDLQAAKRGIIKRKQEFTDSLFAVAAEAAESNMKNGNLMEAARQYKYILKDFPNYPRSAKPKKTLDSLKLTKEYSRALKKWNDNISREKEERTSLEALLMKRIENGSGHDSIYMQISGKIESFRRLANGKDQELKSMASRILSFMSLMCYEKGNGLYTSGRYREASKCYESGVLAEPGNVQMLVSGARAFVLDSNVPDALSFLRKAVEQGFHDRQLLMNDKAFAKIRDDQRFVRIMDEMK
ncbi:MAG TPA: hypothetical protein VHO68_00875 [Bacteroidales bacterium]|nr:hypothetical protein [Bacteroidales bacterium]